MEIFTPNHRLTGPRILILISDHPEHRELADRLSEKLHLDTAVVHIDEGSLDPEIVLQKLRGRFSQMTEVFLAGFDHLSLPVLKLVVSGFSLHTFLINAEFTPEMHPFFPRVERPVTLIYSGAGEDVRINSQKIHDFTPMSDIVKVPCDSSRMINFMCEPMISAIRRRLNDE